MKFTFSPESRPLDGYTIKRAIHRGGFGEVYYAVSDAGREVALKLLHDNAEIELRGVQQCLNLSHPNLVTIFDIKSDEDGDKWIIMEFVGGETLDQAMRRHPAGMPIELVRKWLPGLAAGVSFLHTRGLVHRDLKPANIFEQSGLVKVGDVGLSKFITPSRRSAQTQSVGTVYYMAPEIAKGRYGREVDIYALGVILYEMLTGQVPFDGESTGEILMKHLTDAPDLTKLPPRLRGVVGKALNKEPQNRFSSVNELERAFTDAVLGRGEVFEVEEIKPKSHRPEIEKPFAETIPSDAPIDVAMAEDDKRPAKYNITPLLTASGVAAMVAVLIVFFARSGLSVRFLALQLGVVGVCVYFLTRHLTSAPLATPKKAQRVRTSMRQSTRARWSSFFSAAFLTVPVTAVLTAGLVLLKPTFFENLNGLAQADPAAIGFFSIISIMASWSLSMVSRLGKLVSHDVGQSHYSFAVMGAVVGLAAYFAQQFLMVELPMGTYDVEGIFSQIGDSALFNVTGPTLLGYITFFTFLFGVRNWGQHLSSDRQTRFSVFAVLKALFVGWLATVFFSFPTTWALAWALMIGCVTQVVSPSRIEPHPWQHGRRV